MDNPTEKLREMFDKMTDLRRRLRPTLSDAVNSLDKGLLIETDPEIISEDLKNILLIQEKFSEEENFKKAVRSKSVEQIENVLSELEQDRKRIELNEILALIETLEVDSEDSAVVDAVKKVRLQAEHLRNRSAKLAPDFFEQSAERFVMLAGLVKNIKNFSHGDYLKVVEDFSDNPLLPFALTGKIVHFPKSEEPEEISAEEEIPVEEVAPAPVQPATNEFIPAPKKVDAVKAKFTRVKPNLDLVLVDEKSFKIEKSSAKKIPGVKSFGNKLHELFKAIDPVPFFQIVARTKVFFKNDFDNIISGKKINPKLLALIPALTDRLFNWGLVDKITWHGREFYFLNDAGVDVCARYFTKISVNALSGSYLEKLVSALRFHGLFVGESFIGVTNNLDFSYKFSIPVARAEVVSSDKSLQVVIMFSLTLIGSDWAWRIAQYRLFIEHELDAGNEVKSVFIFAFSKDDSAWLKMFDTVKFKGIHFFLYTWDGVFDINGEQIKIEDWAKICRLGQPSPGRKRTPKLPEPPEEPEPSPPPKKKSDEKNLTVKPEKKFSAPVKIETPKQVVEEPEENFPEEPETIDVTETFEPEEEIVEPEISEPEPVKIPEVKPEKIRSVKSEEIQAVEPEKISDEEEISPEESVEPNILTDITNHFKIGSIGRGMLALHALRDHVAKNYPDAENWAEYLAAEIGFILDDPVNLVAEKNIDTFSFWTGEPEIEEADIGNSFDFLNLAAMIKNFCEPENPTSYQLQKSWNQINEDKSNDALKVLPAAKTLISLFFNFTEKTHRAFADCLESTDESAENLSEIARKQINNSKNIAESLLRSEVNHPHVKDLIRQIFSNNGFVVKYLDTEKFTPDEILNFCREFESENLDALISKKGAHIDEEIFSDDKIENFLDAVWDKPTFHQSRREHEPFKGPKRKKTSGVLKQILLALLNHVRAEKKSGSSNYQNQSAPVGKTTEIFADLHKQIARQEKNSGLGLIVFKIFIDNLEKKFSGESVVFSYRDCLLGAKYIELQNDLPVITSFDVPEFSLQSRLKEFESEVNYKKLDENLQKAYETALKNYDCGILLDVAKNFSGQLKISEEDINRKLTGLERQVDRQIERIYNDFLSDIELARNYSRITDKEQIDFYINAALDAKKHFLQTRNAGLFRRFIKACTESIEKTSLPQRDALLKRLEKLEENLEPTLNEGEELETRYPILANVRRQIGLMNLIVAEDYMNRLETEGGGLLTELDVSGANLDTLEEFLSDYEVLLRAILNASGSVEGAFKRSARHGNRVNRETQNAIDFLHAWQGIHSGQPAAIENSVLEILSHLGYGGGKISARNNSATNQKSYTVTFDEPEKAREIYSHPFSIFGTEIYSRGLEVIYLGTSRKYDNVAQVLGTMTADRGMICLMDHAMTLPERRNLAKVMKLTANLKNIIVIDLVTALFLARFDEANRGKRMLQTTLPFARVQPYTTGGVVAPEMFIGRSEELDKIRDMSGPVFVYGGRQLGKSALLRQVRSIEHNPKQSCYAFFIDLKNHDGEKTLKKIVYELKNAKLIRDVETWEDFSLEMHKLLDGQFTAVGKPKKLLLLLDESDTFLSDKNSEAAIDILRELLVAFNGQFKFVLAGLHKVIRFEQNSSFGNLNHISVLPFRPGDAMELLVKPMSFLGFKISDDSLISAIFSRTNYYPGLIQYYCKMIVDAVGENYTKQNFDVVKNPPYTLDDDYLKNMLGNREFQEEIRQKFKITLCLDDDNYYEILALAVAMIYYENNRPVGADLKDIRDYCLMCGVDRITKLSDAELVTLLDEMVSLNLLRRTEGKFEFNRYAFWHMMGTVEEVNEKLDSYGSLEKV